MPDAQGWTALHWSFLGDYQGPQANHYSAASRKRKPPFERHQSPVLHWAASRGDSVVTWILLDHHLEFMAHQNPIDIWIKDVTVGQAKQMSKSLVQDSIGKVPLELAADKEDNHTFDIILEDLAAKGSAQSFNEMWNHREVAG
jgi:ankyrin repeat protein